VALHHEPPLDDAQQLNPLAAVHIANVLERELWLGAEDTMVAPIISSQLLNQIGLLQRLPVWRAAFANYRVLSPGAESEPAITEPSVSAPVPLTRGTRTTNPLAGRLAASRTATSRQLLSDDEAQAADEARAAEEAARAADEARHRTNRIYAGVAVILLLLTIWFRTQPQGNRGEVAYARNPVAHEAPAVASSPPSPEPAPAAPPQVEVPKTTTTKATPTVAISEPPAQPSQSTAPAVSPASTEITKPTPAPAPVPAPEVAPTTTATNVAPATVVPEKKTPIFRLNGIIYIRDQPSAIVNGQTVNVGDEVDGATVVAISRTTVTLKIDGVRKTYMLR